MTDSVAPCGTSSTPPSNEIAAGAWLRNPNAAGGATGRSRMNLRDLAANAYVDGVYSIINPQMGSTRGGKPFLKCLLRDATGEIAARPADFDLSTAWSEVVEELERHRSSLAATVLITAELAPVLRKHQGRHCVLDGPTGDGRVRARVTAPTALMIAQQLAGWGAAVEVVEPESVRAELARLGAELVARYRTGG